MDKKTADKLDAILPLYSTIRYKDFRLDKLIDDPITLLKAALDLKEEDLYEEAQHYAITETNADKVLFMLADHFHEQCSEEEKSKLDLSQFQNLKKQPITWAEGELSELVEAVSYDVIKKFDAPEGFKYLNKLIGKLYNKEQAIQEKADTKQAVKPNAIKSILNKGKANSIEKKSGFVTKIVSGVKANSIEKKSGAIKKIVSEGKAESFKKDLDKKSSAKGGGGRNK